MDADLDQLMDYGSILEELNAEQGEEYPDLDEPWDNLLAQQELEDFEQCDEYYGFFGGGDDEW